MKCAKLRGEGLGFGAHQSNGSHCLSDIGPAGAEGRNPKGRRVSELLHHFSGTTPSGGKRGCRGAVVSNYLTRFVETLFGFCDTKIGKVGVACGADPKSDGPFNLAEL